MKRREILKAAGLGIAGSAALAMPAIAQSAPELKWRCTSAFPKSLDTLFGTAEVFARYVAEATDNKFTIQIFAAGEIVPGGPGPAEAVKQVLTGRGEFVPDPAMEKHSLTFNPGGFLRRVR